MLFAKRKILVLMVVWVGFGAVCSAGSGRGIAKEKRPTAKELLDKFTETLDKAHTSFITKSKCKVSSDNKYNGKWAYLSGKKTQYLLEEFRTDGERAKQIRQQWGDTRGPNEKLFFLPESEKEYASDTYDGEKRYQYRRLYDSIGSVFLNSKGPGKDYTIARHLAHKDQVSASFGYLHGDIERFDHILEKVGTGRITVRDKMEDLNGTAHYVIDAKTNRGQYTLWLNPEKGYNLSKATVLREAGDFYMAGFKLDTGVKKEYFIENTQFTDVDGVWVPVKAKTRIHNTFPDGNVNIIKDIELTTILTDPEHDALGSFLIDDIKEGARVIFGEGVTIGKYIWRDGKVIDKNGREVDLDKLKAKNKK